MFWRLVYPRIKYKYFARLLSGLVWCNICIVSSWNIYTFFQLYAARTIMRRVYRDNYANCMNALRQKFIDHFGEAIGLNKFLQFQESTYRFASNGFSITPPDILATREATCRACDQWDATALNATGRCRKCGCSTWAKLRMATERCPLGKWEAFDTTNK